jgi:integrase
VASIDVIRRAHGRSFKVRYRDPFGRARSRTFPSRADAERFLHQVESDKARGTYRDPSAGHALVADVFDAWLASRLDLAPSTRALYFQLGRAHLVARLGRRRVGSLTQADVRALIAEMAADGVGRRTIAAVRQILATMCAQAVEDGRLASNPVSGTKAPRDDHTRESRRLSADEVEAIAIAIDPPYRALVFVGAYGGLRFGEATGLRWKRIDMLARRLEVAEQLVERDGELVLAPLKTKASRRTVTLPAFVIDELAAHASAIGSALRDELVFTAPEGGPVRAGNFRRRVWYPALANAAVAPAHFHDLRHFSATIAIQHDAHPKIVQARLGHASIRTTLDTYADVWPSMDAELADALDASRQPGDVAQLLRRLS